jgi:hypothetical protein
MLFEELKTGQVFCFNDGRMSEAETRLPFVKTSDVAARLLVVSGHKCESFVDDNCLGYSVRTDVKMDSTQWTGK